MPKTKAMQQVMQFFEFSPVVQEMRSQGWKDDEIIDEFCQGVLDGQSLSTDVTLN